MAKTAKKKPFKATPASSRRTRGDVVKQIAGATDLKPGKVREVFDALGSLNLEFPKVSAEKKKELAKVRAQLERE